jgi:uncharacterized protein YndB with AHSA1/START domain
MIEIKHKLVIKTTADKIYEAIITQEGLSGWWAKQTIAKPEIGFVNVFTFGTFRNEMEITELTHNKKVEWKITHSIDEWMGTTISFDLEEKEGKTNLRFTHSGWKATTDTYAGSNYDWGRFMTSLKLYCETGTGTPLKK